MSGADGVRLWLLQPVDEDDPQFWYDCAWGFVIRATSEDEARRIAQENGGDEVGYGSKKKPTWLDPSITSCVPLTDDGEVGVVLRDFHAG